MATYKVGYLIGSLAKGSINRKLAKALVRLAPDELKMVEVPFKDLPLYSYDYDADFPPVARSFKDAINAVDAVLFVTPEYNRSAVLAECVLPQTIGHDRNVTGRDRHGRCPTKSAQRAGVLQFAADERSGGLHPIQARPDQ